MRNANDIRSKSDVKLTGIC